MNYDKLEGKTTLIVILFSLLAVIRTLFRTRMYDNYSNALAFKSHYVVVVEPAGMHCLGSLLCLIIRGGWGETERCLVEKVFREHHVPVC